MYFRVAWKNADGEFVKELWDTQAGAEARCDELRAQGFMAMWAAVRG